MGLLKNIVGAGGTVHRYVTTPFMQDPGLAAEVQTQWVQASVLSSSAFRANFFVDRAVWREREMKRKVNVLPILDRRFGDIRDPEQSVLYVLGHSDSQVAEIGGHVGPTANNRVVWWTPVDLVRWLTNGSQPLPRRMLCVKIWSCYSATNGFLAEFSRQMIRAGYRDTLCVGYTTITGAMYGATVPGFPPNTKAAKAADEVTVLGRAKDFRQIAPLPRPVPPRPALPAPPPLPAAKPLPPLPSQQRPALTAARVVAAHPPQRPPPVLSEQEDDDPYADLDIEQWLLERDNEELPKTFLSPRQGNLKH